MFVCLFIVVVVFLDRTILPILFVLNLNNIFVKHWRLWSIAFSIHIICLLVQYNGVCPENNKCTEINILLAEPPHIMCTCIHFPLRRGITIEVDALKTTQGNTALNYPWVFIDQVTFKLTILIEASPYLVLSTVDSTRYSTI